MVFRHPSIAPPVGHRTAAWQVGCPGRTSQYALVPQVLRRNLMGQTAHLGLYFIAEIQVKLPFTQVLFTSNVWSIYLCVYIYTPLVWWCFCCQSFTSFCPNSQGWLQDTQLLLLKKNEAPSDVGWSLQLWRHRKYHWFDFLVKFPDMLVPSWVPFCQELKIEIFTFKNLLVLRHILWATFSGPWTCCCEKRWVNNLGRKEKLLAMLMGNLSKQIHRQDTTESATSSKASGSWISKPRNKSTP